MDILTRYGVCKNVDLEHLKEYAGYGSYIFTDYILKNDNDSYLLFGFEVWDDEDDDDKKFHFFVEEGFEDGSADTYPAEISKANRDYIKQLYYSYINKK